METTNTNKPAFELTQAHVDALKSIKNGSDVYGLTTAMRLREVEKAHPEWLRILTSGQVEAIRGEKFAVTEQRPYFGASLTKLGKQAIARFAANKAATQTTHQTE